MTSEDTAARPDGQTFTISIDREKFRVDREEMTGHDVRHVPTPAIGPDRDLFEVLPDHVDRKVTEDYVVEIYDGKRFFTAPAHINPGTKRD
jgi:hypothetical protein